MLIDMLGHAAKYMHEYACMLGFACTYDEIFIEGPLYRFLIFLVTPVIPVTKASQIRVSM